MCQNTFWCLISPLFHPFGISLHPSVKAFLSGYIRYSSIPIQELINKSYVIIFPCNWRTAVKLAIVLKSTLISLEFRLVALMRELLTSATKTLLTVCKFSSKLEKMLTLLLLISKLTSPNFVVRLVADNFNRVCALFASSNWLVEMVLKLNSCKESPNKISLWLRLRASKPRKFE